MRRLDQIVAAAREGRSAVLAFRGEAGVGKTALLDYAQAAAAGLQVIRIDCVESEMELSFAAVHQLLRPFLAALDILPAPQRAALRLAFGMAALASSRTGCCGRQAQVQRLLQQRPGHA